MLVQLPIREVLQAEQLFLAEVLELFGGHILDSLDRVRVANNTLVVFSTDHGHFLGQHGLVAIGAFHYEDMVRVPLVVRLPVGVPAGRVSDSLQALIDLPETFLATAVSPSPV